MIVGLVACLAELAIPPHEVTVTRTSAAGASTSIVRWYPIGGAPPKIIFPDESALPGRHGVTFPAKGQLATVPLALELVATAGMIVLLAVVLGAGREREEDAG